MSFVIVDTNERDENTSEGHKKYMARIRKVFPDAQSTDLSFGDINVILDNGDLLAIEHKRAWDFLGSIADGRIFRQVEEMADGAKWSVVVITGNIICKNGIVYVNGEEADNWKEASVQGAKWAIEWSGCPIIETSEEHYPYMIMNLINFCSKPDIHWQQLGHKRIVTFPPVALSTEILSAFPGVGLKRAKALEKFAASKNDDGVAPLAESLSWASALRFIEQKDRPDGWRGDRILENFNVSLGLRPWQYLTIEEDKAMKERMLKG